MGTRVGLPWARQDQELSQGPNQADGRGRQELQYAGGWGSNSSLHWEIIALLGLFPRHYRASSLSHSCMREERRKHLVPVLGHDDPPGFEVYGEVEMK